MANLTLYASIPYAVRFALFSIWYPPVRLARLVLLVIAVSQQALGQGFNAAATPWPLPPGGYSTASRDYSYPSSSNTTTSTDPLSHTWATLDMNGDNRPDMVVLTEGTGSYQEPFGTGTIGRYWKVYLNTGAGYATTALAWMLPAGGRIQATSGHRYSFDAVAYQGSFYTGNQGWALRDMNGDSKPDLIVVLEGDGNYANTFGLPSAPYWNVYLNTGTGFSASASAWALPAGGYATSNHTFGFVALDYDLGNQKWATMDMNNDSRPDLVVLTENSLVFGTGTTGRYWKVYLNTGTGYATTATFWSLPTGGHISPGGGIGGVSIPLSFDALVYDDGPLTGDNSWATLDINGDSRLDLVVLTERGSTYDEPFGTGTTGRYWKVYLGTASGFTTTAISWQLPVGGYVDYVNGHLYSFNKLTGEGGTNAGNQQWAVRDINGDHRPDIVVITEGTSNSSVVFGSGTTGRYWKVYLNTGTSYTTAATTWTLPAGGYTDYSTNYSFPALYSAGSTTAGNLGNQSWAVFDLNGDDKQDLIVFAEGDGNFGMNVFGTGTSRYWRAYLNAATGLATRATLGAGNLDLFPNPAQRAFILRLPALAGERTAQLTLLNNLGQQVLARLLSLNSVGTQTEVDVSTLAAGLYTLRIAAGSQTAARQVIVE